MKRIFITTVSLLWICLTVRAEDARGPELLSRWLTMDPFGLNSAELVARLTLSDKSGGKRQLAFTSKAHRYDPPYAKSVVRFSEPADLAGAAFLQVQNRSSDDDRFLFLPELKRARRIASGQRSTAFMGTDLSFADLDQRDFRDAAVSYLGEETISKLACEKIDIKPTAGSEYSHVEVWLRKDNTLPVRMRMYDKHQELLKTFDALEFKRVSGRWIVSRSLITNVQSKHSTELKVEQLAIPEKVSDDAFTVRALEKP